MKIVKILIVLIISLMISPKAFSDSGHSHSDETLHFAHPLISESPSPDTKIRLDYFFFDVDGEEEKSKDNTIRLELEYAFSRNVSIEADIPYTFRNFEDEPNENRLDNIEVGLKLASFIFEDHGILIGGGIDFGLPTGDDDKGIGSGNIWEIEPFVSFGYKRGIIELVSFLSIGTPVNEDDDEDEGNEFGYNTSVIVHAANHLQLILELDGGVALDGEEEGKSVLNLSPGIALTPFRNRDLRMGFGVGFPITNDEEFDLRLITSVFYHFNTGL